MLPFMMKTLAVFCFFILTALGVILPTSQYQVHSTVDHLKDSNGTRILDACWENLECSFEQIELMNPTNRLEYMKYMATWRFAPLQSADQFHAVEGKLAFFIRKDLAGSGTWLSLVNAAVLEAVQRGAAIALGLSKKTGGNPASRKWADYFTQRKLGRLTARTAHDLVWAASEQAAVDHGVRLADSAPWVPKPTDREHRWLQFTRVYRTLMQYRRTMLWLVRAAFAFSGPSVPFAVEAFLDWLTDVTDMSSTGFLADLAWSLSALRLSSDGEDPMADAEVLMQMGTEFWEAFQQRNLTAAIQPAYAML